MKPINLPTLKVDVSNERTFTHLQVHLLLKVIEIQDAALQFYCRDDQDPSEHPLIGLSARKARAEVRELVDFGSGEG